jgi:hypothetical protein
MAGFSEKLSRRIVGAYDTDSFSGRARARRWQMFAERFPGVADMHVLDIGGDIRAWRLAEIRPAHLTLLNITEQEVDEPWITAIVGDACAPPPLPTADLVYSNSVIEHVGGHQRRKAFAAVVRDAAPRYWVQTPNRWFPIEPHFMFPGLQYLPAEAQASLVRHWPLGNHGDVDEPTRALEDVLDIDLVSATEMRLYFPDGEIARERFAGLTKSLISIRT